MFYVFLGHIATLFLSPTNSTTLEFQDPIEQVIYGGSKNDLFTYLSQSKKTLVVKPHENQMESNLTVITKNNTFNFWVKIDKHRPHIFVRIFPGAKNHIYSTVFENSQIKVQEGDQSNMIFNMTKNKLKINDQELEPNGFDYFSKGIPLIINGERVWN
jgi:hypothetical protein